MKYEGKGVEVDGTTVTITTDSEATARGIAAAAERDRLKAEGGRGERAAAGLDGFLSGAGKMADKLDARVLHVVAWAATIVGCFLAWKAGQNLSSLKEASDLFSIALVALVLGGKYAAGRAGREYDKGSQQRGVWLGVTSAIFFAAVLSGAGVNISAEMNRDSGRDVLLAQSQTLRAEISDLQAEQMQYQQDLLLPMTPVDVLESRLEAKLKLDPMNQSGAPSGKALSEWLDYGTDEFCRGSNYYKNRYCPDILDMQAGLDLRRAYEATIANIDVKRAANSAILDKLANSQFSTFGAVSEKLGGALLYIMLVGAFMTFIVDGVAFGAAFLAYRYPEEK